LLPLLLSLLLLLLTVLLGRFAASIGLLARLFGGLLGRRLLGSCLFPGGLALSAAVIAAATS
jgi:hypothetical protein